MKNKNAYTGDAKQHQWHHRIQFICYTVHSNKQMDNIKKKKNSHVEMKFNLSLNFIIKKNMKRKRNERKYNISTSKLIDAY